jgi:hypothetical protein
MVLIIELPPNSQCASVTYSVITRTTHGPGTSMGNCVINVNDDVLMRRDRSERMENHGKHISINLFEMGRIWDS